MGTQCAIMHEAFLAKACAMVTCSIGDELSQEDVLVAVQRVDQDVH